MARLKVNWTLLIVLLLSLVVLGLTVFGLRGWNRNYRAKIGKEKGLAAFEQKQWPEAAQFLGQYLGVHPNDTEMLLKYAQSQMSIKPAKQGNLNQAVNAYRSILRQEENLEAAKNLTGIYLWIAGLPGEGQLTAERFLEKQNHPEIRQLLAACLIQQKQYDKAIQELNRVIQDDPTLVSAYDLLAQVTEKKDGNAAESERYLTEAIEKNPQSAMAYLQRANYRLRTGKQQQAIEDLTQAGQCELDMVDKKILLAEAWLKAERPQQTQELLEQILSKEPQNLSAWLLKARLALAADNPEDMATVAEEGIKAIGEESIEFMPMAAELFIKSQKIDRARDCVAALRKAEVNEMVLAYIEGVIAEKDANWSLSAKSFRKAYDLGRKDEETVIRTAGALARCGDYLAASQITSAFLNAQSESFRGQLLAGDLMARQRQWTLALNHLKKAILLNPNSGEAAMMALQVRMQKLASTPVRDDSWDALINDITAILKQQDNASVRALLFQAASAAGKKELMKQQVDHLKSAFPEEARTTMIEAEYLVSESKFTEAAEVLTRGMEKGPNWEMARVLVLLNMRQKNIEGATAVLTNFIAQTNNPQEKRDASVQLIDIDALTGKRDQAYESLKKLAADNPDDIALWRKLLDMGLSTEKVETLGQWVDQVKLAEGQQGRQWRYEQARLWFTRYEKQKYYTQIVDLINEILRFYPDDKQSILLLAATHEASANRQLALKSYLEALSCDPDDVNTAVAVIAALYRNDEYLQGHEILKGLTDKGYRDSRLTQLEMQYLAGQKEWSTVSEMLEKEIEKSPNNQDPQLALALVKINEGDYAKAEQLIDQLLTTKPDSMEVLAIKVRLYLGQAQNDKAIQFCNDLVTKYNSISSYYLRCETLISLKRIDEAQKDIETLRTLMTEADKQMAELTCAQLYSLTGDQKKALDEIQTALKEGLDRPEVRRSAANVIGNVLQRIDIKKDAAYAKQAEQMLNDILNKDSQNVQAVFTLAMLYHGQDYIEQAAKMYERTLALDPTQGYAANNLAWILCQHQKKPEKALELANKTLQIAPTYADLWDTRGVIYMTLGDFQKAVDDFLQSTTLYAKMTQARPEMTASTFRLGKCYVKLNKAKEAREELLKAKELYQKLGGLTPQELAELDSMLSGLSK
ncbi:MAG: tetratricopeptide repeat protein [Anaerohalosphaeraceae bacterium]